MNINHSKKDAACRAVVVDTALVTALGDDPDSLWRALMKKETAIEPISRFSVEQAHYQSKIAALIDDLKSPPDRSLLPALLDRLIGKTGPIPPDTILVTASIKSGIDNLESLCRGRPTCFPDMLLSSLAEHIGGQLGLKGDGLCISASCASATIAVIRAAAMIESGQAEAVLVCCADIITEYVFSGFSSLKALSPHPCQPFDRNRQGLSLGEGAAALLLMRADRANREGRDQLGTILGWGITNDAAHITAPVRGGLGLAQAIDNTLKFNEKKASDIAAICAHGTGTVFNDRMELDAFQHVFGHYKKPIFSVKGAVGHTLGAAGGIEVIMGLKALSEQTIPPTVGFETPQKGAEGQVSSRPQSFSGDCLLTTNSGFGGINAAIVLNALRFNS